MFRPCLKALMAVHTDKHPVQSTDINTSSREIRLTIQKID